MDGTDETFEQLELLIGKENAKKVYEFFAGENIYFSKKIEKNETHAAIYAELCAGQSYRALTMKYGYTKSYIRKIQHKFRKKERLERQARRENGGGLSAAYWKRAVSGTVNTNKPAKPGKPFDAGDLFYE